MPELDDKTTDKLFQVGAGRHDFEYEPAAWEQMEQLLDADDSARRKRILWLLTGGLLLLLVAGVFGYQQIKPQQPASQQPATEQPAETEPKPGAYAAGKEQVATLPTAPAVSALETATESKSSELPATVPAETGNREYNTAGTERANEPAAQAQVPPVPNETANGTATEDDARVQDAAALPAVAINTRHTEAIEPLDRKTSEVLVYDRLLPQLIVEADEAPEVVTTGFNPGLAATVSLGTASGMVEAGDFGPLDTRFGAKLEYRFSNKLSLGGGAYFSNICYRVDGTDYKATEHVWTNGVVAKDVEADCDILEVPLTLTWYPGGSDRSGLYFGGGLTSYFMLTEQFTFKYDVPSDNLISSWREDNTNRHLFGLGQVNLGYQRKAGRRSALQIESYVQLPLTDIGHGKVNLFSVGASVNYTFDFRKRN